MIFKPDFHKFHTSTGLGLKNNVSSLNSENNAMESGCDFASGDADEITAVKKSSGKIKNSADFSQIEKSMYKKTYLKNIKKKDALSDGCIKVQKPKNRNSPQSRN